MIDKQHWRNSGRGLVLVALSAVILIVPALWLVGTRAKATWLFSTPGNLLILSAGIPAALIVIIIVFNARKKALDIAVDTF